MAYTSDLTEGLATLLTLAGAGVYRRDGPPYTDDETGIFLLDMPDAPDRAICLTPYPVTDDVISDTTTGMQIRYRAGVDPLAGLDVGDQLFDLLHNRRHFWCGQVAVAVAWRQSEALLGQDAHGRPERTSNFYFQTTRSTPNTYE